MEIIYPLVARNLHIGDLFVADCASTLVLRCVSPSEGVDGDPLVAEVVADAEASVPMGHRQPVMGDEPVRRAVEMAHGYRLMG